MRNRRRSSCTSCASSGSSNYDESCFLKSFGLELCTFLYFIASSSSQVAVQLFYIDRICRVSENFGAKECANLTHRGYDKDEKLVEVTASEYTIYQNLIENLLPVAASFFLGPWTDKHGSKRVFTIALIGYFISALVYTGFSLFPTVPPDYILLSSVPIACGGGIIALILSACSHVTRENSPANRSFRLAVLSVSFDGGMTVGFYLGKSVYNFWGFTHVFVVAAVLYGVAVICAILFITESCRTDDDYVLQENSCCGEFFDVASVKDTILTTFRPRRRRWMVLSFMTCIMVQYLSYCVRNFTYLYTRNVFGWSFAEYSNYSAVTSIINIVGGVLMTSVAIKLFHIPDPLLGLITVLSNLAGYLVMMFGTEGWFMYLGSAVQMFGALTVAVMRSILSKSVESEEHGKLFSFVTCMEFTMQFVAGSTYGLIFMGTATTFPTAIFLVPIAIQTGISLFYIFLLVSRVNVSPEVYSALQEEDYRGNNAQRRTA